jgi:hypothetical protein
VVVAIVTVVEVEVVNSVKVAIVETVICKESSVVKVVVWDAGAIGG